MKIAIRVDSSHKIGSGHVMRCLTLAKELKEKGGEVIFICKKHQGNIIDIIKNEGFEVKTLEVIKEKDLDGLSHSEWLGCTQETDAQQTIKALESDKIDCFIIDNYALDYRFENKIRHLTEKIMVIDDLADRKHDADIILDQNYYHDYQTRYDNLVSQS